MTRIYIIAFLFCFVLAGCSKKAEEPAQASLNNTTWKVNLTVTGNTSDQDIFEFNNGGSFAWRPAGASSYTGTWTQSGDKVTFTFKETTTTGAQYFWDNTGTLSTDGSTLTGTMQRRGASGSGTFTAKKL